MNDVLHINTTTLFATDAALLIVTPYLLWSLPWIKSAMPLGMVQLLVAFLGNPVFLSTALPAAIVRLVPEMPPKLFDSVAWIAVMLFMFSTGGHSGFDRSLKGTHIVGIAAIGLVVPLVAGTVTGAYLRDAYPLFMGRDHAGLLFDFSIGICMTVTALPMLALLVADLGLSESAVGRTALSVAFLHDIALWVMLALVAHLAKSVAAPMSRTGIILILTICFVAAQAFIVRPMVAWLWARSAKTDKGAIIWGCGLLFSSAAVSDLIGLHLVTGAFLAGVIAPRDMFQRVVAVIEPISTMALLPMFFAASILAIPIELNWRQFLSATALMIAASMLFKVSACAMAARLTGFTWKQSLTLGSVLQCKGIMEIVAVLMLRDAGIVSSALVGPIMMMSVITTLAAKPLAQCVDNFVGRPIVHEVQT